MDCRAIQISPRTTRVLWRNLTNRRPLTLRRNLQFRILLRLRGRDQDRRHQQRGIITFIRLQQRFVCLETVKTHHQLDLMVGMRL